MAVSPYISNMHAYIFNMKSKETQPPHPGGAQAPSTPSLYFTAYEHACISCHACRCKLSVASAKYNVNRVRGGWTGTIIYSAWLSLKLILCSIANIMCIVESLRM